VRFSRPTHPGCSPKPGTPCSDRDCGAGGHAPDVANRGRQPRRHHAIAHPPAQRHAHDGRTGRWRCQHGGRRLELDTQRSEVPAGNRQATDQPSGAAGPVRPESDRPTAALAEWHRLAAPRTRSMRCTRRFHNACAVPRSACLSTWLPSSFRALTPPSRCWRARRQWSPLAWPQPAAQAPRTAVLVRARSRGQGFGRPGEQHHTAPGTRR
jgi:hypothetical protein